jgi:hypothetical protein
MFLAPLLSVPNGHAFPLADCPVLPIGQFRQEIIEGVAAGGRLSAFFAYPGKSGLLRLFAVLARTDRGDVAVVSAEAGQQYAALTPDCPQAHLYLREIFEQWKVRPAGHPWLKPVRFPSPQTCGVTDFFQMQGEEVHEVAVGPVHAGIIEPGHFRFQCHGEMVYHLEISLGYQHRGVEGAMRGGPHPRTIHYVETLAGDSTAGHATAYCRAVEAISTTRVPARGQFLRGVALELERVANHLGDLGALAGDVGFLPTMSYCGRIRGDVLNMTAMLRGNRFGRGMVRPGGVAFDVDARFVEELRRRLHLVTRDARSAVELLWNTPSVMARFDGVGVVPRDVRDQLGLVGVAARAGTMFNSTSGGACSAVSAKRLAARGRSRSRVSIAWPRRDAKISSWATPPKGRPSTWIRRHAGCSAGRSDCVKSVPAAATLAKPIPMYWVRWLGTWAVSASSSWLRRAMPTACWLPVP